jgi:hypothetical protein
VQSTEKFRRQSFGSLILEFEHRFDTELDAIPIPSLVDSGPQVVYTIDEAPFVSKWIVNLATISSSIKEAGKVIRLATDPFTLWLRGSLNSQSEQLVVSFLNEFGNANPHGVLNIVLETEEVPQLDLIDRMIYATADPDLFTNQTYAPMRGENTVVTPTITIIRPYTPEPVIGDLIINHFGHEATVVWSLILGPESVLEETRLPILIDFVPDIACEAQKRIIHRLASIHSPAPDEVRFRDSLHYNFWKEFFKQEFRKDVINERIFVS